MRRALRDLDAKAIGDPHKIGGIGCKPETRHDGKCSFGIDEEELLSIEKPRGVGIERRRDLCRTPKVNLAAGLFFKGKLAGGANDVMRPF